MRCKMEWRFPHVRIRSRNNGDTRSRSSPHWQENKIQPMTQLSNCRKFLVISPRRRCSGPVKWKQRGPVAFRALSFPPLRDVTFIKRHVASSFSAVDVRTEWGGEGEWKKNHASGTISPLAPLHLPFFRIRSSFLFFHYFALFSFSFY